MILENSPLVQCVFPSATNTNICLKGWSTVNRVASSSPLLWLIVPPPSFSTATLIQGGVGPILLIDSVLSISDNCQGLMLIGPILVSEGVDVCSSKWDNKNNYVFLSPKLILRVLQLCLFLKADGTSIVPEWPQPIAIGGPWFIRGSLLYKQIVKVFGYLPKR